MYSDRLTMQGLANCGKILKIMAVSSQLKKLYLRETLCFSPRWTFTRCFKHAYMESHVCILETHLMKVQLELKRSVFL